MCVEDMTDVISVAVVGAVVAIADSIDSKGEVLLSRRAEFGSVLLLSDPVTEVALPSILGDAALSEPILRRDEKEYRFLSPSRLCFAGEISGDTLVDFPICCSGKDLGPESNVSSILDTNIEEAIALVFAVSVEASVLAEALLFEFELYPDEIFNKG